VFKQFLLRLSFVMGRISSVRFVLLGALGLSSAGLVWALGVQGLTIQVRPQLAFPSSSLTVSRTDQPFTVQANATGSLGAVAYSSSQAGVATVNSQTGLVTLTGNPGEAIITAAQQPWERFPAATATLRLTVLGTDPGLSWAPVELAWQASDVTISPPASANTQAPFVYEVIEQTPAGVVTLVAPDKLRLARAGVFKLRARQAAAGIYSPAAIDTNVTVRTVSPGQLTPPSTVTTTWADAWIALPQPLARALGSGALSYSVVGGADVVAQFESPAGGVTPATPARLKPGKAGTVRVRMVQAADAQYQSAQAEFDVVVTKASPQLSWSAWATPSAVYAPDLVVALPGASVVAGSGPVTYSTSNSQVATVAPNGQGGLDLRVMASGSVQVQAVHEETATHARAVLVQPFSVTLAAGGLQAPANMTVTWSADLLDLPWPTQQTPSTGGLTYSLAQASDVADVLAPVAPGSPWRLRLNKPGVVAVKIAQAGDSRYAAAETQFQVVVNAIPVSLAFTDSVTQVVTGGTLAAGKVYPSVAINTSNADPLNRPGFSSSNPAVLQVDATTGQLTPVGTGSVTITASQAAAGGYGAASALKTVTVVAPALSVVSASVAGANSAGLAASSVVRYVCPYASTTATYTFQVSAGMASYVVPTAAGGLSSQVGPVGGNGQFTVTFELAGPSDSVTSADHTLTVQYGTHTESMRVTLQPTTIGCASSV
jgi:hypothetical protein